MARTKISEFSATPGNNTDIDSINIAEGCAPSGINDAIRELMAQLKDFQTGAVGDSFNGPVGTTTAAAGAFTTLSASSTVSGTGFSTYLASPPSIGSTAAGTGAFTTLAASGAVTLSGGTANGVTYLNGSKVLTSGSALVFDGSNLGLGVTPSAWANSKAFDIGGFGALSTDTVNDANTSLSWNSYATAYNAWKYKNSGSAASKYTQEAGQHKWYTAPSGTAGAAISFTQAMTLDASGNLGIGTTSISGSLHVAKNDAQLHLEDPRTTGDGSHTVSIGAYKAGLGYNNLDFDASRYLFKISGTERARIDSSGNLLVGTTSNSVNARLHVANSAQSALFYSGTASQSVNGGENAANAMMKFRADSVTNRSINSAGTNNASGADYAEYMTKAGEFNVAKGDVIGINADGKLTNVFADAVSFCVKSTNPSYVGGDTWGIDFEDDAEGLEAARQTVDRIAFAGQVPVNVTGATAGQYIVPVNDNGAIKGEAVSSPTFEQYQQAVGKVIAIEADGRARIIVKVA